MKREWVLTKDGSPSLFVPDLNQNYHSHHGALQESRHVFIEAGLKQFSSKAAVSILEIGFGTGLNALLSHFEKSLPEQSLLYHSLEKYPLSEKEWRAIHWPDLFQEQVHYQKFYQKLHEADWGKTEVLDPYFRLFKEQCDLITFSPQAESYDLIYFDAFSPEAQPELWSQAVFEKMSYGLKKGGYLVTYCVKGIVRRSMKAAGLEVEKIPGPPGKREMSRARPI